MNQETAKLVLISGPVDSRPIALQPDKMYRIGRDPKVDIPILANDRNYRETVSRWHAEITTHQGNYSVVDLNSTNGTRLNGQKLEPGKAHALSSGDTLSFGQKIQYVFSIQSEPLATSLTNSSALTTNPGNTRIVPLEELNGPAEEFSWEQLHAQHFCTILGDPRINELKQACQKLIQAFRGIPGVYRGVVYVQSPRLQFPIHMATKASLIPPAEMCANYCDRQILIDHPDIAAAGRVQSGEQWDQMAHVVDLGGDAQGLLWIRREDDWEAWELSTLLMCVGEAMKLSFGDALSGRTASANPQAEHEALVRLVGSSEQMQRLKTLIMRTAKGIDVLITGEPGVGKELVAEAIHACGRRSAGPFVPINCASLPETLIESELFGHEKGAHSMADKARPGVFEQADGGTLFLDEIGELPLSQQAQLLRVLESRRVRRVGGNKDLHVDFRLISATNQNLKQMVRAGGFRADLYSRIVHFPIHVPPLCERMDDMEELVRLFIRRFAEEYETPEVVGASADVMQAFSNYHWPMNVRQLRDVVRSGMIGIMPGETELRSEHLVHDLSAEGTTASNTGGGGRLLKPDEYELALVHYWAGQLLKSDGTTNVSKVADELGVERKTVYKKLHQIETIKKDQPGAKISAADWDEILRSFESFAPQPPE